MFLWVLQFVHSSVILSTFISFIKKVMRRAVINHSVALILKLWWKWSFNIINIAVWRRLCGVSAEYKHTTVDFNQRSYIEFLCLLGWIYQRLDLQLQLFLYCFNLHKSHFVSFWNQLYSVDLCHFTQSYMSIRFNTGNTGQTHDDTRETFHMQSVEFVEPTFLITASNAPDGRSGSGYNIHLRPVCWSCQKLNFSWLRTRHVLARRSRGQILSQGSFYPRKRSSGPRRAERREGFIRSGPSKCRPLSSLHLSHCNYPPTLCICSARSSQNRKFYMHRTCISKVKLSKQVTVEMIWSTLGWSVFHYNHCVLGSEHQWLDCCPGNGLESERGMKGRVKHG